MKHIPLLSTCLFGALAVHAAIVPVSVTKGELVPAPKFDTARFTVTRPSETIAVPLDGWRITWPLGEADAATATSGVSVVKTNAIIRGSVTPALRIELTRGYYPDGSRPVVQLDWPFSAETHNILSFTARVEVPEGLSPVIGDSPHIRTGMPSAFFERNFDEFGVAVHDVGYAWMACGVPTTHFRWHVMPATRTADGFEDFQWDMKYEDYSSNKSFVRDHARGFAIVYDTRKIPDGKKVVITFAAPTVSSGAHLTPSQPERYAAWTNDVAAYKPDYSDSSTYLLPPETGRLAKPLPLARGGKAAAEIIVDLSDALFLDNWFPTNTEWTTELLQVRGYEVDCARFAAYELADWLGKVTGGDFPVLLAPSGEKRTRIYLGAPFAKRSFAADLKALAAGGATDGYAIRGKDGDIYIFGARPAGTLNGCYAFVENNTDLIWAFANDPDGTLYTVNPDLDAVWGDVLSKPAFIQRGWGFAEGEWKRHNAVNFSGDYDKGQFHTQGGHFLCSQYYDNSAGIRRYNAMINGRRARGWSEWIMLACLADPDYIGHAVEFVPGISDLIYHTPVHCIIGQDDNYGYCECPLCTAPIVAEDGEVLTPQSNYADYYGAWFYTYLNKVDDLIQARWPGFRTGTFAYFANAPYPRIKVNKTIFPRLCTYVRKAQNEPIFAPVNQHWWKIYNDWVKHGHGPNIMLYDYFGLGFYLKPKAEVLKFDLQAQRDIGILRTYTEGGGYNEYMGVADERWCMARLAWDPDLDVEQLHRYFNRRAYREAAPWIDKFRGTIRENFYKHFHLGIDFEDENRAIPVMIENLGLAAELHGYLDKARAAVKHPQAKLFVEKLIKDYDAYMAGDWKAVRASRRAPMPKDAPRPPTIADELFETNRVAALALAKRGEKRAALAAMEKLVADRRIPRGKYNSALVSQIFPALVGAAPSVTAADVLAFYRRHCQPGTTRALGVNSDRGLGGEIRRLADAFAARGDVDGVVLLYDEYAMWDGDVTPIAYRASRATAKIDYLRGVKRGPWVKAFAARAEAEKPAWIALLRKASVSEGKPDSRGTFLLRIYDEEKDGMSEAEREAAVDHVLMDDFMSCPVRYEASKRIPGAHVQGGGSVTNWYAIEDHVIRAVADSDWSYLYRTCYSRSSWNDLRLNAICDMAALARKAGRLDVARSILDRGAPLLGYYAGMSMKEPNASPGEVEKRVKKLDDEMEQCGTKRR